MLIDTTQIVDLHNVDSPPSLSFLLSLLVFSFFLPSSPFSFLLPPYLVPPIFLPSFPL